MKRSYRIAVGLALFAVLWILSGLFADEVENGAGKQKPEIIEPLDIHTTPEKKPEANFPVDARHPTGQFATVAPAGASPHIHIGPLLEVPVLNQPLTVKIAEETLTLIADCWRT